MSLLMQRKCRKDGQMTANNTNAPATASNPRRRWFFRRWFWILLLVVLPIVGYLVYQNTKDRHPHVIEQVGAFFESVIAWLKPTNTVVSTPSVSYSFSDPHDAAFLRSTALKTMAAGLQPLLTSK